MHRIAKLVSLFILCSLLTPSGYGVAQAVGTIPDPVTDASVARLADAVENLTRLLESQATAKDERTELRKLDIAISYLNFRSRRIETMERDLGMIKNERARIEDALQHWQTRRDLLNREMEEASGDEKQNLQREIQEMAARQKNFEQRLARYEEDIILHENRMIELQAELDSVESYVQKNLDL